MEYQLTLLWLYSRFFWGWGLSFLHLGGSWVPTCHSSTPPGWEQPERAGLRLSFAHFADFSLLMTGMWKKNLRLSEPHFLCQPGKWHLLLRPGALNSDHCCHYSWKSKTQCAWETSLLLPPLQATRLWKEISPWQKKIKTFPRHKAKAEWNQPLSG